MLPNSRTNYRPLQNKSRRRENILEKTQGALHERSINHLVKLVQRALSELPQFLSISPPFPYIQLRFPYNFLLPASELYRRKSGHRDLRKRTFQVSEENTSWATRCQY